MENTNREVKIAIIVGIIMVTLCAIAFIAKNINSKEAKDLDIHVLRHVITNDANKTGIYYECNVPTDKLSIINIEFKKIMNLTDSDKKPYEVNDGVQGNYKIESGSNFIAFDDSKANVVYRNDTTSLYSYRSNLYKIVEEVCQNIDLSKKEDQTNDKKDQKTDNTKNDKKDTNTKKTNKK